jgi:hypothetical protein
MAPAAPPSIPLFIPYLSIVGVADANITGFLNFTPATSTLRSAMSLPPLEIIHQMMLMTLMDDINDDFEQTFLPL